MKNENPTSGKAHYIHIGVAALLVLITSVALWYFHKEYPYRLQPPRDENHNPTNGVWDMTIFDLDNEIIFIEGPVEYVTGKLLTPEEFDAYEGEILYDKVPSDTRVATARLRLIFPEDKVYTFAGTSVEYSERVYVNGVWRHDVGSPGMTAEESVAVSAFTVFDVLPENGMVEIVRQSSNFVHKEGGGYAGYYIGSPKNIRQMATASDLFAAITAGLLLCLFILNFTLFLLIRGYKATLWFSLLCLLWMVRICFTGHFIGWAAFPGIPWALIYRMGCASIAATGALLLLLVRDEFPGTVQKWPLRAFIVVQAAFFLFFFIADTVTISRVKVCSEILLYIAAAYLAARFIMVLPKQIRQRKLLFEQGVTLIGLAMLVFTLLHDAMRYNNVAPGIFYYEIGDVGIMILTLLQAAAMVFGAMRQLAEARRGAQIAWETAEAARKNERLALLRAENAERDLELQRQLAASIPAESLITYGSLTLDTEKIQVFLKGDDLQLTPKEFALLLHLIRQDGEPVSREVLYEAVWRQRFTTTDRAFDSSIYRLRKKLEGCEYQIANERRKGYWLEKS